MFKLNFVLGATAAVAIGVVGGWSLMWAPSRHAPAQASISTAHVEVATTAPSAEERDLSAPTQAPPQTTPAPAPEAPPQTTRDPAPEAPPSRSVEAAPPAPPAAEPEPAKVEEARNQPRIHLDGERSEVSFEGDRGSLSLNKERLSVGTPFGKFEFKW
jgi:type IV secretory pathway VirB10-like protein